MRKYDNMNSLTLKSEYSEDYSELGPQLSDDANIQGIMNSKSLNKHKEISQEKSSSLKGNDTLSEIIQGLSKDESDKHKMKNAKKIKNKKLQLSNANSEIDVSEGLKPPEKKSSNKLKSWTKEIKPMKSKNSKYNYSIQKYPSTTSPRNILKSTNNTSTQANGSSSLTNTYSTFRTDNKTKNLVIKSSNNISNTMEKVKSQATLLQNDLQKLPIRKLSEDFHSASKTKDTMPRKESTDRLQSPLMYKDKIECAVSLLNNGAFSPSTSSQSKYNRLYIYFLVGNIVFPSNVDQLESVSDEWMTSPLNKIPIRTSKLISEKPVRTRDYKKSLPDYYNLK
jgi:hypothetical protein